jgi:hypothetical protein
MALKTQRPISTKFKLQSIMVDFKKSASLSRQVRQRRSTQSLSASSAGRLKCPRQKRRQLRPNPGQFCGGYAAKPATSGAEDERKLDKLG